MPSVLSTARESVDIAIARRTAGKRLFRRRGVGIAGVLIWLLVIFNLLMFVWILLASLKDTDDIYSNPLGLPQVWHWDNYLAAINHGNFGIAFINTVVLVAATATGTIVLAAPAAYALSRFGVRGSRPLILFFALGLGVPSQVLIIPLYVALNALNLINNLGALWFVYLGTSLPFAVFLLTGFFSTIPKEVEEAAAIDGASANRTFWQVSLPMVRSGLITVLVITVVNYWSETIFALVFLQTADHDTLPLALLKFLRAMQYGGAIWGELFAGVVIVLLPVVLIYIWLGRRIIEGLTLGVDR